MESTAGLSWRRLEKARAQPSPSPQVMSPFPPSGLAQSQHSSGLSWGKADQAGLYKHGLPHVTAPVLLGSGHLTPAQGLLLGHQLSSWNASQCWAGGDSDLGGTKPGPTQPSHKLAV